MFDYLAIDWGSKKFGLALGNSDSGLVLPHAIIAQDQIYNYIDQLLSSKSTIQCCIVSHNQSFRQQSTATSIQQEKFCQTLQKQFPNLKILLFNERGSTSDLGTYADDQAAARLLTWYFEHRIKN